MSTSYRFTEDFNKPKIIKAVKKCGLLIHDTDQANDEQFCITDGSCYLWAYVGSKSVDFCRYGSNYDVESAILKLLAEELGTKFISEHDDGFFNDEDRSEE